MTVAERRATGRLAAPADSAGGGACGGRPAGPMADLAAASGTDRRRGHLAGITGRCRSSASTPRTPRSPAGSGKKENEMSRILGSMRRIDEKHGALRLEDAYDTNIADL